MKRLEIITGTRRNTREGSSSAYLLRRKPHQVIVGDATGVDEETFDFCIRHGIPVQRFYAVGKWPEAGPLRNGRMVEAGLLYQDSGNWIVRCTGFPDARSKGTHNCMNQARLAGIRTRER